MIKINDINIGIIEFDNISDFIIYKNSFKNISEHKIYNNTNPLKKVKYGKLDENILKLCVDFLHNNPNEKITINNLFIKLNIKYTTNLRTNITQELLTNLDKFNIKFVKVGNSKLFQSKKVIINEKIDNENKESGYFEIGEDGTKIPKKFSHLG